MKLNVIHASATGHVLGIVTTGSDAARKLEAKDVAGGALLIQDLAFGQNPVGVSSEWLSVKNADAPSDLVVRPRKYGLVDDQLAVLGATLAPADVTLSKTKLDITVPAAVAQGAKVCAVIEKVGPGGERTKYEDKRDPPTAAAVTIDVALSPGDYGVLVLLEGCAPFCMTQTLT